MKHKKLIFINLLALIAFVFVVFIGLKDSKPETKPKNEVKIQSINEIDDTEITPDLTLSPKEIDDKYSFEFFKTEGSIPPNYMLSLNRIESEDLLEAIDEEEIIENEEESVETIVQDEGLETEESTWSPNSGYGEGTTDYNSGNTQNQIPSWKPNQSTNPKPSTNSKPNKKPEVKPEQEQGEDVESNPVEPVEEEEDLKEDTKPVQPNEEDKSENGPSKNSKE